MSRLSIEITDEQHQRLKAMAALQGKSIKQYVLEALAADEALRQLEDFLAPRIEEAQRGEVIKKSAAQIFSEVSREHG